MATTQDIVAKLWNLCNVLRDDGITYHQYVTELTYLLFLKMVKETGRRRLLPGLPLGRPHGQGAASSSSTSTARCSSTSAAGPSGSCRRSSPTPSTTLRQPKNLGKLVADIDELDWYGKPDQEGLGDLYEGLLEKNATEKKSGAGQYFTPRPLIDPWSAW